WKDRLRILHLAQFSARLYESPAHLYSWPNRSAAGLLLHRPESEPASLISQHSRKHLLDLHAFHSLQFPATIVVLNWVAVPRPQSVETCSLWLGAKRNRGIGSSGYRDIGASGHRKTSL